MKALALLTLVACAEPPPIAVEVDAEPPAAKCEVEVRVQGFDLGGSAVSACGLYMMHGEAYGKVPVACVEGDPRGDALFLVNLEPGVRRLWFYDEATFASRGEPWYAIEVDCSASARRFSVSLGVR